MRLKGVKSQPEQGQAVEAIDDHSITQAGPDLDCAFLNEQPLYNVQGGISGGYQVQPEDWISGLCTVFACALQERFGLPIQALVEEAESDGNQTVVHAFCLWEGKAVDARGLLEDIPSARDYVDDGESIYYQDEPSSYKVIPVTPEDLQELHYIEDMSDTAAGLWFIDHSPQFDFLRTLDRAEG